MQRLLLLSLVFVVAGGCAGRGGVPERTPVSGDIVSPAAILGDLERYRPWADGFEGRRVTLVVKGPGLQGTQMFPLSTVYFASPDKLHVIGRKFGGKTYVRITVAENAFLLELPVDRQFFYRAAGESFSVEAPEASPGDVVEELFPSGDWSGAPATSIRVVSQEEHAARVLIDAGAGRQRLLEVVRLEGQWVLQGNTLLHNGVPLVEARYSEHRLEGGKLFPVVLEVSFPTEESFFRLQLGTVSLPFAGAADMFDVGAQLEALRRQGFEEREPFAGN